MLINRSNAPIAKAKTHTGYCQSFSPGAVVNRSQVAVQGVVLALVVIVEAAITKVINGLIVNHRFEINYVL